MPKRNDIKKILVIGSGPIVIGQACEFDYSGTQAIKALKEEGFEVILVNSNPATIMTDPEISDRVYIEPIKFPFLVEIIKKEKPCAILPTMGGQTALNAAMELHEKGILKKYNVELLGAKPEAIEKAENRELFKKTMEKIGIESAKSKVVHSLKEAHQALEEFGLPLILRPSFTLGGEGGGIAFDEKTYFEKIERALFLSPTKEVLVEESLLGWKEFELEVVRDQKDNVIIVCSIENVDPMGVHTGDSITVAPAQTLTDKEFQNLRNQSIKIIREIGVETGGSNVQFAVNPKNGRIVVIEMNPRVSRSSALASKATGFPIARVAAKLAIGYSLDEIQNDITKSTPASFEPSIDYVVTKIPRFDFEKFPGADPTLNTSMKSVGEVMALGKTFEESFGKALCGLENGNPWLRPLRKNKDDRTIRFDLIDQPNSQRMWAIADALRLGTTLDELHRRTMIDPWFLEALKKHVCLAEEIFEKPWPYSSHDLLQLKKMGWTDLAISKNTSPAVDEVEIRKMREHYKICSVIEQVDTCAAEFHAETPYYYSTYHADPHHPLRDFFKNKKNSKKEKVIVLGGGPNRIGQGIEFDYCCVHAALALNEMGYETIMINSNPETVSTDFDTSDHLYFEPLTPEHVLRVHQEEGSIGAVVQFGGQTPLKISKSLEKSGISILGTSTESIDLAEDRKKFDRFLKEYEKEGLYQPPSRIAEDREEALKFAKELGFPVLVRPSYVLGGRAMRIVKKESELLDWIDEAILVSENHPVLLDRYLENAIEVDLDCLSDGKTAVIAGLMEHIEEAGVHSGDSACSLPSFSLRAEITDQMRTFAKKIALQLQVKGLMNAQFAFHENKIYLLEVNPRASRTVPFISKATGYPLAKLAIQVMMGKTLPELGLTQDLDLSLQKFYVKAPVFPFDRFTNTDVLLGPEMRSTGEVMGIGKNFEEAYAKALWASNSPLPKSGKVFLSIRDDDKEGILPIAKDLSQKGFLLYATGGTQRFLSENQIRAEKINKVTEGSPHCVEAIRKKFFDLIINTVSDQQAIRDSFEIRRSALESKTPYCTLLSVAKKISSSIQYCDAENIEIYPFEKASKR